MKDTVAGKIYKCSAANLYCTIQTGVRRKHSGRQAGYPGFPAQCLWGYLLMTGKDAKKRDTKDNGWRKVQALSWI